MNLPTLIFDVDYTLYNSKDIPEEENHTDDISELFYSLFSPKKKLYEMLEQYTGKKYLFSNGNLSHVSEVIKKIGLELLFPEDTIATLDDYLDRPKPYVQSYKFAIKKFNLQPNNTVYFFEDNLDNLKVAKQKYNWKTIYIDEDKTTNKKLSHYTYVDYTFKDIDKALHYVLQKINKQQIRHNNKQNNSTQNCKRISPKISPRRRRPCRKKIDGHLSPGVQKQSKHIKKSTIRSPFRHRHSHGHRRTNYMYRNRINRLQRQNSLQDS